MARDTPEQPAKPSTPRRIRRRTVMHLAVLGLLAASGWGGWQLRAALLGTRRLAPPAWELPLPRPVLGAHRGGAGLFPENTLEAFQGAYTQYGARFMELDVRGSADGVPIVLHDATLQRTTNGHGPAHALPLRELATLDASANFRDVHGQPWAAPPARIPTLRAVLAALPDCVFSVDIKQADLPGGKSIIPAVVADIRETGMAGRVLLGSARHGAFLRIQALAPEIPSFFSFRSAAFFHFAALTGLARWYRPAHNALLLPTRGLGMDLATPTTLAAAHALGLPMLLWTVNDPAQMRHYLRLGVDGLITDRPDLLRGIMQEDGVLN